MDNLEKVKRHLGKTIPIVLKNSEGTEDTFDFKPLNIEQQALLMEVSKKMGSRGKVKIEGLEVPDIQKEDMTDMFDLILDITRCSIKDLDESMLIDFVNNNFDQLSDKIADLMPKRDDNKAIARLKKKQEDLKNARKPESSK